MAVGVDLCQVIFDRSLLDQNEDVAVITMHVRGVQASLPDNLFPLDDAGRTDFAARLDTFFAGATTYMSSKVVVKQYRFYKLPDSFGLDMGPPVKVVDTSHPGKSSATPLPNQIACSITFKTDRRKTWGRFYLPGLVVDDLSSVGLLTNAMVGTLAQTAHALTSRSGNGGCLTVWSRKEWTHHDPQVIQVDNIPDVIRRRRASLPTFKGQWGAG